MSQPSPEQRPFAAFDIDGTVIRWQLYHALADEMMHMGLIDADEFEEVRAARMTWKRRANDNSFTDYEHALVQLVDKNLPGTQLSDFEEACDRVMDEYSEQVYTYTRDLIKAKKQANYLLFAISASQSQIVGRFAAHYGFDDFGGSEYEVIDGVFTGVKSLLLKRDKKPELLQKLAEQHNATWLGSIAVGDSESDIPMLESVENPIAFNPSTLLFEHAKQQGWNVVVERKNMVYELEASSGLYRLKG